MVGFQKLGYFSLMKYFGFKLLTRSVNVFLWFYKSPCSETAKAIEFDDNKLVGSYKTSNYKKKPIFCCGEKVSCHLVHRSIASLLATNWQFDPGYFLLNSIL